MICPKCQSEVTDGSAFCTKCGAALGGNNQQNYSQPEGAAPQGDNQNQGNPNPQFNAQGNPQFNAQGNPQFNNQGYQQNYAGNGMPPYGAPYVDPKDHTAEFTPQDISEHKVFAMLPYLLGTIGIIIALLAAKDSKYIMFHVREALKLTVCAILVGIVSPPHTAWASCTRPCTHCRRAAGNSRSNTQSGGGCGPYGAATTG